MKYLKAHWRTLALIAAGIVLILAVNHFSGAYDDAIAQIMADQAVARHRAAREAIIAKYAALNAAKDLEVVAFKQGNAVLAAKVVAKQKELNVKVNTLQEATAKLSECTSFLGEISYEYNQRLIKADGLRLEQLAIKDAEIEEWKKKDSGLTSVVGTMTKRIVQLEAWKQRKLVIGPQVGYGIGGAYIGVGATWELVRLKAPGQQF